jgi:hypothetical protein
MDLYDVTWRFHTNVGPESLIGITTGWVNAFTQDGTFTDMSIRVTYRGETLGDLVEIYATDSPICTAGSSPCFWSASAHWAHTGRADSDAPIDLLDTCGESSTQK